jgi:large subunit ribosomal protein L3
MASLIGKKVGMTQVYENGVLVPVSVIELGPCSIVQVKTKEKDGYEAIQLGFSDTKKERENKAQVGHFEKAKVSTKKHLREVPVEGDAKYEVGATLDVTLFNDIKTVTVVGTNKGKGFAGGMKRYGFHGMRATHGVHETHRHIGSIGMRGTPGRVLPLKKMPGHMGNVQRTCKNLSVIKIDKERNLLLVKGTIPGANGNLVIVKKSQ